MSLATRFANVVLGSRMCVCLPRTSGLPLQLRNLATNLGSKVAVRPVEEHPRFDLKVVTA